MEKAGQPLLSQVKVVWQEQNVDMPLPLQAPACIPSVFNGNRIVVYGFASNCYMVSGRGSPVHMFARECFDELYI